jgi:hypothetical protein
VTDSFRRRVAIHRALDWVQIESSTVLDGLRGLGIEGRAVKLLAAAGVIVRYAKTWSSSYREETTVIQSIELKRLLHSVFDMKPGWNSVGPTWVYCEHAVDAVRASVDGHTEVRGTEDDLWPIIQAEFSTRLPCAVLTETREGYLRVEADRPTNARALTSSERALGERVRKYVDAGVATSVLLYGPQGSAKTTAACSIASECAGGYFRLSAEHVSRQMAHALVRLAPGVVIVDDIDRIGDVSLLEMLDALTGAGVVTICTSNTAPDNRHGDSDDDLMDAALVRSGRLDIHHQVARLDDESHAEIMRAVGLADVDLGPNGAKMLASDLACLGRMHRAGDLEDPPGAVADLLQRRTNNRHTLRVVPTPTFITAETITR